MKRKILWAFLIIWLILTAYLLFLSNKWASAATPSYAASSAVTTDNFAELLRETLQKNPDLLLSVLRENSEAVLDIAQEGSNQRRHKSLIAQWKAELNQPKEVDIKDRPFRGAADAPVTIVAYSDFTCPYCQQAAGTMEKVLKENQGKIKYVFKHFPLETTGVARLAAEYHVAAARQDPELAWKFYDLLFARRADVLKDGEPAIVNAAKDAGLNMKKLAADVKRKARRSGRRHCRRAAHRRAGDPVFPHQQPCGPWRAVFRSVQGSHQHGLAGRSVRAEVTNDHHPQSRCA